MSAPADAAWLPAVERWAGGPVVVRGRRELIGGYVSDAVRRVDLDRAGRPPADDEPVADDAFADLARVHAHWQDRRPPGVPVVDAAWWAGLCDFVLAAVSAASARTGDARFAAAADLLRAWRDDGRVARALDLLPTTLVHGDPHRANLLAGPDGTVLIDWGGARVAPAGLDLAVLAAQGAPTPPLYRAIRGAEPGPLEAAWATLQVNVQYMAFAAEHRGPARVAEMAAAASTALELLGAGHGSGGPSSGV